MARSSMTLGALSLLCSAPAVPTTLGDVAAEQFSAFVSQQGRAYGADADEYSLRFALFQQRLAEVEAQNAKASRRWTAAINSLADRTDVELAALRGYRHGARAGSSAAPGLGLAAVATRDVDLAALPSDFTWQHRLKAMKDVSNQGSCGSCWAVSSATVLRAHAELYQTDRKFSAQQIVDCTPNPRHCGGNGGCSGATAELAMEYAAKQGLVSEEELQYTGVQAECPSRLGRSQAASFLAVRSDGATLRGGADGGVTVEGGGGASFGLIGWKTLPENAAEPLLEALYKSGPVVVSVAASSDWSLYSTGVMDSCKPGAVINHAVVLTGFGVESGTRYWQIQNSWGPSWGEDGFIRIIRREAKEESAYCGWDRSPQDGTACQGGPEKVWVCGSCGVLYDSVVPTFRLSSEGWWHREGNRSTAG